MPLSLFVVALAVRAVVGGHVVITPDTDLVLNGTAALDRCFDAGLHGCDDPAAVGQIGYQAPLQYLPTLAFKHLGFSRDAALHGLIALNALAVVALLAIVWRAVCRIDERVAPIALAAVVSGPLLFYAAGSWGEPLATLATAGAVAALLANRTLPAATALFFATLSKESALPLLLAVVAVALVIRGARGRRPGRRELIVLGTAAAGGIAIAVGLNLLRYGSPYNTYDSQSGFVISSMRFHLEWVAAQLVAPNGGIVWFWGPAVLLVALAPAAARGRERSLAVAAATIGLLVIAGLSAWYTPFGWQAWGPRLLMPWLPALVLLAVAASAPALGDLLERSLCRPVAYFTVGAITIAFALPHLAAQLEPSRSLELFGADATCPVLEGVPYYQGPEAIPKSYFRCQRHAAWAKPPILLGVMHAYGKPRNALFGALLAAALGGLLAAPWRTSPIYARAE